MILFFRYESKKSSDSLDESDRANFFALLRLTSHFSSLIGETVVSGKITSIAAGDVEKGEQLAEASRAAGQSGLELFEHLRVASSTVDVDANAHVKRLEENVQKCVRLLNELLPKVHDISKEEIGDLVEKEMQNTTQAIEAAVAKLEVTFLAFWLIIKILKKPNFYSQSTYKINNEENKSLIPSN